MALLVTRFRSNDWEDELGKALAGFESSLSAEQRAGFCAIQKHAVASPPTVRDVMNLTAEVDYKARQQKKGAHRCLSPRFTRLLEAVQQYASIGDVLIGGSQNLIACGVWSLVRTSLLAVCKFAAYFESMSLLCMKIGQSAPRLQEIASLFPHSKALRGLVAQYFISVVGLCQKMVSLCQQSVFGQMKSFLHDGDTGKYETELVRQADAVQAQLQVEQAKATSRIQSTVRRLSSSETHRRNLENHLRVLDLCSTYSYKSTWKRIRKLGNSVWTFAEAEYGAWLHESKSATLLVRGKLGSGKSVLLANMVDDLNLNHPKSKTAYFFCREDDDRSLECRTILGCLAHQLLQPLPPHETSLHVQQFGDMDSDDIVRALKLVLAPSERILFILDGIEACSQNEREEVMSTLQQLQEAFHMALCVSYSIDASAEMERETSSLPRQSLVTLPDDRPEISDYIEAELLARLDSNKLRIGDPRLIVEIHDALITGAQGMFLWVHMQIEAICMEKTDQEIREVLKALPKSLPEIFRRILSRFRWLAPKHQVRVLQILAVSLRPLHLDEFEEAISVVPGDTRITRAQIVNDVRSVLASCGSLVMVDEELSTIHFIHHSVQQFVLGRCHDSGSLEPPDYPFSEAAAHIQMGEIVVTYLAWGGFDSVVSRTVVPEIPMGGMPSHIVQSIPNDASPVKAKAMELLQRRLRPKQLDIGKVIAGCSEKFSNHAISQFHFRDYALEYWLHHTKMMDASPPAMFTLFTRLVAKERLLRDAALWKEKPPSKPPAGYLHRWAIYHSHAAMLKMLAVRLLKEFLATEEAYLFPAFARFHGVLKFGDVPDAVNELKVQAIARFHGWLLSQLEIIQTGNGLDGVFDTLSKRFDVHTRVLVVQNRRYPLKPSSPSTRYQLEFESFFIAHRERLTYYQRKLQELRIITREPTIRRYITLGAIAVRRGLDESLPPISEPCIEEALESLVLGVEDWNELKVEALGKLLLHGPYPLPKCGQEEPLELYLFETTLLCVRRIPLAPEPDPSVRGNAVAHGRTASFELKGQWSMADITVSPCGAPGLGNQNCLAPELGELHVQVRWSTDRGAGFFIQFDSPRAVDEWMSLVSANRQRGGVYEDGSTLKSGWLSAVGIDEDQGPQLRRAHALEALTEYREGDEPGTP